MAKPVGPLRVRTAQWLLGILLLLVTVATFVAVGAIGNVQVRPHAGLPSLGNWCGEGWGGAAVQDMPTQAGS